MVVSKDLSQRVKHQLDRLPHIEITYQTQRTLSDYISKHPAPRNGMKIRQSIFEGLLGVWLCGLALS